MFNKFNLIFFIQLVFIISLIYFLFKTDTNKPTCPIIPNLKLTENSLKKNINDFKLIGLKHGTDKANGHNYQNVYGLYLGPLRYNRLNLLEIGLGCTMAYGPGKSIPLWYEYLPFSNVDVLEYDKKCAKKFKKKVNRLYIGDQSDLNLLNKIIKEDNYDVIIDDGGHSRKQQIFSLIGLWPGLKSNGLYFIEDIFTSLQYHKEVYDYKVSTLQVVDYLIKRLNYGNETINDFEEIQSGLDNVLKNLTSVHCFSEVCVFTKR